MIVSCAGSDARDDKGQSSDFEGSFGLVRMTKNGGASDDFVI